MASREYVKGPVEPLIGVVTQQYSIWTVIECDHAPSPSLKVHNLIPLYAKAAKLGDRVRLEYYVNWNGGRWMVAEILPREEAR